MRNDIITDRLTLTTLAKADGACVAQLANDLDVARMLTRMPHPYALSDFDGWQGRTETGRAAGTDFVWAIRLKTGPLVGCIGLHQNANHLDLVEGAYEIGYWLGRPFWGQGYATEAAGAVIAAFEADMGCQPLVAGYFIENPRSGHVLEKLGFQKAGAPSPLFSVARQSDVLSQGVVRPATGSSERPTP